MLWQILFTLCLDLSFPKIAVIDCFPIWHLFLISSTFKIRVVGCHQKSASFVPGLAGMGAKVRASASALSGDRFSSSFITSLAITLILPLSMLYVGVASSSHSLSSGGSIAPVSVLSH